MENSASPKKRSRLWWAFWLFIPVLAATVVGVALVLWSLKSEPAYYREAREKLTNPVVRKAAAQQFQQKTEELLEAVRRDDTWTEEFTDEQINSWLIDELPQRTGGGFPSEFRDPLISFQQGTVQLGCRVQSDQFSGVVSIQAKPALLGGRELELEVTSIQAGSLPLPATRLLREVVKQLQGREVPIRWNGDESSNRLVLSLPQSAQELNEIAITELTITPGRLTLRGARK